MVVWGFDFKKKITNIERIYFLKLYLDSLTNLRHN
jgi:hypothetical protein